jgi:hypothetical protein
MAWIASCRSSPSLIRRSSVAGTTGCVTHDDLIFDEDMSCGVHPLILADRQAASAVVVEDLLDAIRLIELEPFLGVGSFAGEWRKNVFSSPFSAARLRCRDGTHSFLAFWCVGIFVQHGSQLFEVDK